MAEVLNDKAGVTSGAGNGNREKWSRLQLGLELRFASEPVRLHRVPGNDYAGEKEHGERDPPQQRALAHARGSFPKPRTRRPRLVTARTTRTR